MTGPTADPWPANAAGLAGLQERLAALRPPPWRQAAYASVGGCFVCFQRGAEGKGERGEPAWAAAALWREGRVETVVVEGSAGAAYEPGLLALREGEILARAVRALGEMPDVLLVNATGRDHPRRAGLALHLGWVLGVPTVGVTHRPLAATGEWPGEGGGERSPLLLGGEEIGAWVRTREGARPVAVHAAWLTDVAVAVAVVLGCTEGARTPEPLRAARRAARAARAHKAGV
ncbi:MAG: endonuclease V [Chloroflexi bacterium]|nr:endonuclease V [Chloroflexota bacterium]